MVEMLAALRRFPGSWGRFAHLLLVFALILTIVAAVWPSFVALHARWTDVDALANTHGYLVVAVCLGLIVRARDALASLEPAPAPVAIPALLLAGFAWAVFFRAGIQDLHLLMIPVLVALSILVALGWVALQAVIFPIAFFVFALPGWDSMSGILQSLTSRAVAGFAWLVGLPAYVEGNFIHIPEGVFHVEDGCSGLHFFVVALALAALHGELERESLLMRVLLLGIAAVVAVVSNWVRVITIVIAGHLTDMQSHLITQNHYLFGWCVFAVAIGLFLYFAPRSHRVSGVHGSAAVSARPVAPARHKHALVFALIGMLGLAIVPVASRLALARVAAPLAGSLSPPSPSGWTDTGTHSAVWRPRFVNASASVQRTYVDAQGNEVELFAVVYREQRQDAELIGYGNSLYGAEDTLQEVQAYRLDVDGSAWVEHKLVDAQGRTSLVRFRYYIDERPMVHSLAAQIWYGVVGLTRSPTAALIAYRAACDDNCPDSAERITHFARAVSDWSPR